MERRDPLLRFRRVRAVIRLLGEVRELGNATPSARAHLVSSLLNELGAVVGGAVMDRDYRVGGRIVGSTLCGFDSGTLPLFGAIRNHGSAFSPFLDAVIGDLSSEYGSVVTATENAVLTRRVWVASTWFDDYVRPAGIDRMLGSIRRLAPGEGTSGFAFMRAAGDIPFSEEDRLILYLVHLESPRLFETKPAIKLGPRLRQTLERLLAGDSDKEIAARLEISHHTAREYVKAVFRAHGVSSRAVLLAKYLSANG